MYLYILFLMAVNILCQLRVLESMDSGNKQQDGGKNGKVHLLTESVTELLILQMVSTDVWLYRNTLSTSTAVVTKAV